MIHVFISEDHFNPSSMSPDPEGSRPQLLFYLKYCIRFKLLNNNNSILKSETYYLKIQQTFVTCPEIIIES